MRPSRSSISASSHSSSGSLPATSGVSRLRAPATSPRATSRLTSSTRIDASAGSASAALASNVEAFVLAAEAEQLPGKVPQLARQLVANWHAASKSPRADVGLHEQLPQPTCPRDRAARLPSADVSASSSLPLSCRSVAYCLRRSTAAFGSPSSTRARAPASRVSRSAPSRSPRRMRTSASPRCVAARAPALCQRQEI